MQLAFGAGALWGNRTDVTGSGIGPEQFGILKIEALTHQRKECLEQAFLAAEGQADQPGLLAFRVMLQALQFIGGEDLPGQALRTAGAHQQFGVQTDALPVFLARHHGGRQTFAVGNRATQSGWPEWHAVGILIGITRLLCMAVERRAGTHTAGEEFALALGGGLLEVAG